MDALETRLQKGFYVLLDCENRDEVENIKVQLNFIDGISFSKIGSVDDMKVFADIESTKYSLPEIANWIIKELQFNGVIEVYEKLIVFDKNKQNTYKKSSFIKGNPVTKLALVLFNDKNKDYRQHLNKIILDYGCFNISIDSLVSDFGRKYYLARFDSNGVDLRDLDHCCGITFHEDSLFSINRNNKFDYEECLLEMAKDSMAPIVTGFKVIKQNNYFDFSGDDSSHDPRFW